MKDWRRDQWEDEVLKDFQEQHPDCTDPDEIYYWKMRYQHVIDMLYAVAKEEDDLMMGIANIIDQKALAQ